MKKIAVIIVVFIILLSGVQTEEHFTLLDYFSGEYTVYTSTNSGENCVNLGFCYMNSQAIGDQVVGESMVIQNLEIGTALSDLKARVVKTEYLEDGSTVIYAYTNLIDDHVEISGKIVNLQIANKENRVVIGWPLILGSF